MLVLFEMINLLIIFLSAVTRAKDKLHCIHILTISLAFHETTASLVYS